MGGRAGIVLLLLCILPKVLFAGYYVPPAVNDDMSAATYDPQAIVGDAFNLNLHTGTIAHDSLTGTGTNSHAVIDTFIASKAQASGLASLYADSLVVQNPASGTITPTASKILIADGAGKIADGWLSTNVSLMGQTIAHNSLTGTGTNSHAVIDTFIASKAQASGLASLYADSLVVQNPASGTITPTASKILIAEGSGKIADGWLSSNVSLLGQTIAHDSLTGTGTNSHAVIDTHLLDSDNPHGVTLTQTAATIAGVAAPYIAQTNGIGTGTTLEGNTTFPSGVWGNAGSVGIGTTTPGTALAVIGTVTGSSIIWNTNDNSFMTIGSNTIGTSSININSSGTLAKFMRPTVSNGNGVELRFGKNTSNNYAKIGYGHDNDTQKSIYCYNVGSLGYTINGVNGGVLINKTPSAPDTTDTRLRVRTTDKGTGTVAMRVQLDNAIIAGGGYIQFADWGGSVVGSIDAVDYNNVAYNNFAGAHSTIVENTAVRRYTILESTGETLEGYDQLVKTRVSSKRKSKRVYGVYVGKIGKQDGDGYDLCQSLGAGYIWVVNMGENIKVSDYLMSSDVAGYAEKQDDNIMRNYSIAKSTENVIWKDGERKKLIACTIHGG